MADIRAFFQQKAAREVQTSKSKHSHEKSSEKKKERSTDESSKKTIKNGEEVKKKKRVLVIDSDSDEEPLPSSLRKKEKKDEDNRSCEDGGSMQRKEKDKNKVPRRSSEDGPPKKSAEQAKAAPKKTTLNPTTPIDFFGGGDLPSVPVKRKKEKSEGKDEPSSKMKKNTEFTEIQSKIKKNIENGESHKSEQKSSLAGKLASKVKESGGAYISPDKEVKKKEAKPGAPEVSRVKSADKEKGESKKKEVKSPGKEKGESKKKEVKSPDKESKTKEAKLSGAELKNKDALNDYINQAKQKEKTAKKEKEKTVKSPPSASKEAKTPPSSGKEAKTPKRKESDTADTPQEDTPKEKKNTSYWAYKSREGPTALGSKELPVGSENCLAGLTFVITGVLESFDREQFVDCIQRYGGKVTGAVSGKTSFLIVGREPGQSKITKAEKVGTKQIDEDGFIELVSSKSKGKTKKSGDGNSSSKPNTDSSPEKTKKEKKKVKSADEVLKEAKERREKLNQAVQESKTSVPPSPTLKIKNSPSISTQKSPSSSPSTKSPLLSSSQKSAAPSTQSPHLSSSQKSLPSTQSPQISGSQKSGKASSNLWVEKYKPKNMKQIVGQQGEKSNANKLKKWLINWKTNNGKTKPKTNYMAGKEDGSIFKAALLSGSPGVGKTTTATLVCQEVGFSFVEMNASDTRGKKALDTYIKESMSNVTVDGMMQGVNDSGRNHVLIMDEVDGMAGNEDRGGMQELIQLIKKSQIPVICMCNDRNHQKIRSLSNYCFDLRFHKPRVEQIKGFALSVAAKEGLKIPPQAMEQIVIGTNQDIRQVLHNLQMWTSTNNTMDYDDAKESAKNASKNIKMGNFDIVKKLFTQSDSAKMSIDDRLELFFMDYSFVPLFMQENYLNVNPAKGSGNVHRTLELMSQTADSIADGNLVESLVRGSQSWGLLPLHGLFSTAIPSMTMSGYLGGRIDFPAWLGKNSSRGKHDRILQELKTHIALSSDCVKSDVNLEYLPVLKRGLTKPLVDTSLDANDAAKQVIKLMDDYNLTREDWDSITDISKWGNEADIVSKIPTKVKSAFTRLYNKEAHRTPFALQQPAKKSKGKGSVADDVLMDGEEEEVPADDGDDEDEDDVTKDAMIKMKKEPKAGISKSKTKSASSKSKTEEKTKKKKK